MDSYKKTESLFKYLEGKDPKSLTSISDIEIKEFEGEALSEDESKALYKFRKARLDKLNNDNSRTQDFNERYEYLRAVSNLIDYRDILNGTITI